MLITDALHITAAQLTSAKRFVDCGATLLEVAGDYFFFETFDEKRFVAQITPKGFSHVYNMTYHASIDDRGECYA